MTTAMLLTMVLCFALTISVAVSIGLAALVGIQITNVNMLVAVKEMFSAINKFPLAAIPFFILAGNLMETGGISRRLVEFAKSLVGGVQGGLPMTCVLTCMIFAAVSGSSVATTFAIGAILVPALIKHGYPTPYAAALQATSAELGVVIPPSIPMILYGVAAEVSIGEMFIAGVGPGLLIGGALMLFVYLWCKWKGWGKSDGEGRLPLATAARDLAFVAGFGVVVWLVRQLTEDQSLHLLAPLGYLALCLAVPRLRIIATAHAGLALLMPVIILGGIYGGIFTPTEASAVAVFYALLVGMGVYGEIGAADLYRILRKSVMSAAVIMFIIANAGLFAYLITRAGVPTAIGEWLKDVLQSPLLFLLGVNLALFLIGMFIETSAAIIVLAPILAPVALFFGVDPVHFGVVMVVNLALGMITPPFGVNLFAACTVARISLDRVVKHLVPFVLVVLACLMVITFTPALTLTLRDLVYR
ncbi:MAG: TRAP transporter large permease [Rubrivivax sp.]|nr:TRAP transporter large permease [Rubrivivax sp.]